MRLLKEIFNETLGMTSNKKDRAYDLARASRVVVFNNLGKVALLNIKNEGYHKLPGGKIVLGETRENAALREVEEETGFKIEIENEIGLIIEYSDDTRFMQISFAYKGRTIGEGIMNLSDNEKRQGVELEWYSINDAIDILKNENPNSYHGKFIVIRDLCFLEEAIK